MDIFWKWEMLRIRKMFLVKSYCMPNVLKHGVETWPRTKADPSMLMAAEMKFCRIMDLQP